MPSGIVSTARGESLNMDELKAKATLPLVKANQTKTQVKKKVFSKRQPLNVRGFQPGAGEHVIDQEPPKVVPDDIPPKTSFTESGEAETVADVTGVKVKVTEGAIKRAKERAGLVEDEQAATAAEASDEALGEILGDLAAANPNAESAAAEEEKKPSTRRTRSKKS